MIQWNEIKTLEIESHKCNQLVFGRKTKAIQYNKDLLPFQPNVGTTRQPHAKNKSRDTLSTCRNH